jgi:hypothetical protein
MNRLIALGVRLPFSGGDHLDILTRTRVTKQCQVRKGLLADELNRGS